MFRSTAAKAALALALVGGLSACAPSTEEARETYACSYEQVVRTEGLTWENLIRGSMPSELSGYTGIWEILFEELNGAVHSEVEVPVDTVVLIPSTCPASTAPSPEG